MRSAQTIRSRRGAVAPLAALLLALLVGMLAFAIDVGYIAVVKGELQNAADAAALAGAARLQNPYVQYYLPGQLNQLAIYNGVSDTSDPNSAVSTAQRFAKANVAGGVNITVPADDITFSYYDGTNPFTAASYPLTFPNTVTVTTRRDDVANTSLRLFFAQIFGITSVNLTATASATVYAGDVTSLQAIPGVNAHILPVALDVNVWKNYYATGVSADGLVHLGPNGAPQLQVYPFDTNTPGSFGLLDVGPPANNVPAFQSWIDHGETPNDIGYLLTNKLLPVSPDAPQPWKVGPGLKSTLVSDFQSQMGVPNLIPLFVPASPLPDYVAASGNGQNATYAIIGFVGVTVTQASGNGLANMNISIQPTGVVDPTAVIPSPTPARPGQVTFTGTKATTFVSAKLTK
jgi:Flp pilus assembly protein TadG